MSDVHLKNYMEDCVNDMVDSVLKALDCCTCDKCKHDIVAIALNNLKPKYVVTRKGQLYTKISALHKQADVDIITAIAKGAGIVRKNPRHDQEEE